jgi:4-amino-4-deoxy-L-arabinose transferase-like glycosyltransferase
MSFPPRPVLDTPAEGTVAAGRREGADLRTRVRSLRAPAPELALLLLLAAVLNLWALSKNGWANDYYSAAVRSMGTSWHDFLYASLDQSGVMTVDKPPLALWVQALSVRAFGFHPLSILVPQALMGMASVALVYDLVRRRFGRLGGAVAGLALALTPITVAVSRHNNPDALLVLCCVAALWFAVRALQDGRTRWLVAAGVCVGLGFETKMGVALVVVPAIAAAWLLVTPAGRGRLHATRQLLGAGAAMVLVGGAWPALVELTPASQRPWVSGTSDNSVLSLIFGYNGVGRVDGQSGGPGGFGGGNMFGGGAGPARLLNSALGGQAGWLLGFAVVSLVAIAASTRLRRADARSGWIVAVGGSFLTTAALFSFASGIFHPYYVALLAPFTAALVGAGAAYLLGGGPRRRLLAAIALAAAIATELVVVGDYPGQLSWLPPILIVSGLVAALALLGSARRAVHVTAVVGALAVLLIAPAAWSFDTLGYATSGTFPAGGPASAADARPGGGRFGPRALGVGGAVPFGVGGGSGAGAAAPPGGEGTGAGSTGPQLSGQGSPPAPPTGGAPGGLGGEGGIPRSLFGGAGRGGFGAGPFGGGSIKQALAYAAAHGGGTVAVSSQSTAAGAIISEGAHVAGIGGFSGRESSVSVSWLAAEVAAGKIRWVLDSERGAASSRFGGAGLPGDTRAGSRAAISAAAQVCTAVTTSSSSAQGGTLYDCSGKAAALAALADRSQA